MDPLASDDTLESSTVFKINFSSPRYNCQHNPRGACRDLGLEVGGQDGEHEDEEGGGG